jgi:hypothetical protein
MNATKISVSMRDSEKRQRKARRCLARDARTPIRVRDPDYSAEFIELLVNAS